MITNNSSDTQSHNHDLKPSHIGKYTTASPEKRPDEVHGGSSCRQTSKDDVKKLKNHEFFPNSTKIGFGFVGIWVAFILIAKIMYTSSDQYKTTNKYDLVIFKPPAKYSAIGPRRIYSNNNVNLQNINAALASGIDLSVLNVRNTFQNQPGQSQSQTENLNSNGTPRASVITIGKVEKF